MAQRSKGFGKPVYTKKAEVRGQQELQKFSTKFSQNSLSDRFTKMVANPKDISKMSEILEEFAEPYHEFATTYGKRKKLFETAMLAWNLCLIPEDDRASSLAKLIEQEISDDEDRRPRRL